MPRTADSIIQACLVLAVILMSPYAMFAGRGCGGRSEAGGDGSTGARVAITQETTADTVPEEAPVPEPEPAGGEACSMPGIEIPRSAGCEGGGAYPECRWQLPDPGEQGPYEIWRYTTPDHRWGRPALVGLVLAVAARYSGAHGGEKVTVGDLDAPGGRHRTHSNGVDVDLYLPRLMAAQNMGKGRFVDNYAGRSALHVAGCRERVLDLARMLATCSQGRLRIYYNDPPVIEAFLDWFGAEGLASPFGRPIEPHNDLHRFHFHVTIDEDLPLPGGGPG